MRKLSPHSSIPSPFPLFLRCLYPSIYTYIYIHTTDDNRQKLTAERAAIVDRGVETVNSHCTGHNVLLRCFDSFLRHNPIPVSLRPTSLPSFLPSFLHVADFVDGQNGSLSDNACLPSPILRPAKLFGETVQNSLMERVHLALLAL